MYNKGRYDITTQKMDVQEGLEVLPVYKLTRWPRSRLDLFIG